MNRLKIIGPFCQIVTMKGLPTKGAVSDNRLEVLENVAVMVAGERIKAVGKFQDLTNNHPTAEIEEIPYSAVLLPGFIDCHTHTCFAGTRANDFALRIAGKSYAEIAQSGGGIWQTVEQTRGIDQYLLFEKTKQRVERFLKEGITTLEIKSGYGLSVEDELSHLEIIHNLQQVCPTTIVPTCLAAHIKPHNFDGNEETYLAYITTSLLPELKRKKISNRVDIFVEKGAFGIVGARKYLKIAQAMGFDACLHADQFTAGGASELAVELGAVSADHLEASGTRQIEALATSNTVAVALPGASLGLGEPFAPARKLLDAGACLAIASDYNPGSAPMGNLLLQASVLACYEKLSTAEVFAGLTFRAAKALQIIDHGRIQTNYVADMQAYLCQDYREILYQQGYLKPTIVWKKGSKVTKN